MKKLLLILMFALVPLSLLAQSALAAGGPPTDILKGVITEVNAADRTIVFQRHENKEFMTLTLAADMKPEEMRMHKKVLISLDKAAGENVMKDVSIMFMDMTGSKLIALLVIGLIGGLLSGFIGSGGAFVMTPAMMSLGVPGAVAVASNMCHKFPKAMIGAYKRWKYGQADIKLGLVMAVTAVIGVQIGITIQKHIMNSFGNAGSNLYVSAVFMVVLVFVGGYVFYDAWKLAKGDGKETVSKLALRMQKIQLAPMMHFKTAKVTISAWITIPVGVLTGMLAATIAVGGFIGVPGMIYVVGASAVVASATELIIAFVMGAWGSVQWGLSGLIDIRLSLLLLATSLIGVQLGALGTTYVKDYIIKVVMATTMLIVAVSRGAKIPGYLADLDLMTPMSDPIHAFLEGVSFWALVLALGSAGLIITVAMVKGMSADRQSKKALAGA
ncbi:sulfite exporter TauE/SafE family protein [Desulfobacterales bacterium RS19-109]|uniref:Probable membrane transporter protein n=2 Tax=Thiovibrio frasassiensis TaxID=2984131 RepID=A0A9X4RL95_9BACT|nr:sulfite exporter TauE/SafE family protein [Thiovibrio frasassiensis]MDG4475265.1 sulfite exporter TauE/SafE family protein [Thiovibrio frasassiensis]